MPHSVQYTDYVVAYCKRSPAIVAVAFNNMANIDNFALVKSTGNPWVLLGAEST